jgi:hypothetical protein
MRVAGPLKPVANKGSLTQYAGRILRSSWRWSRERS